VLCEGIWNNIGVNVYLRRVHRGHRPNQVDASQSLRGFFLNCSRRIIHYYLREQREQSILRTAARRAAANSEVRCLVPSYVCMQVGAWCLYYVYAGRAHTLPCNAPRREFARCTTKSMIWGLKRASFTETPPARHYYSFNF
jgi:hypothetical protein